MICSREGHDWFGEEDCPQCLVRLTAPNGAHPLLQPMDLSQRLAAAEAALLKAKEEIARLKEIHKGCTNLVIQLDAERARCERLESVLKTIEYTNRSRGYPTGSEWRELIRLTKQALSGGEE